MVDANGVEVAEVDNSVLVATLDVTEFRMDPTVEGSAKNCWKSIIGSLRSYKAQREELMRTTTRQYQIAASRNHVDACNILIAALKAEEIRTPDGTGLTGELKRMSGGRQTKRVLCEAPWDLMGYIAKYADDHWQQTADVKFPDGPPPAKPRKGKGGADATDAQDEDEFSEEVEAESGDEAEGGADETSSDFGDE